MGYTYDMAWYTMNSKKTLLRITEGHQVDDCVGGLTLWNIIYNTGLE